MTKEVMDALNKQLEAVKSTVDDTRKKVDDYIKSQQKISTRPSGGKK